jgi:hypothetical protein
LKQVKGQKLKKKGYRLKKKGFMLKPVNNGNLTFYKFTKPKKINLISGRQCLISKKLASSSVYKSEVREPENPKLREVSP